VGTLDSYFDAHMDLVSVDPVFNLYNADWPILTNVPPRPPAKFVLGGRAYESLVCSGSIVTGTVARSVLSPDVFVEDGAWVENSVLMSGVRVGRGAVVRNAILDKNVVVGDGQRLGVDLDADADHHKVTDSGIVVLGKKEPVHAR
ncbi:MAG: glucose-1-phosphate adenylyltransferase, partial [Micromonosporaceae bacterium]